MRLILTLTGGRSPVPDKDKTRMFATGSLSIGRGPGNDWVLADPDRNLSKTHCAVTAEGGRFVLTDLSSNGVYVNGAQQATERDSRIVLTDGDTFRLGDYVIAVAEAADRPAPTPDRGNAFGRSDHGINPSAGSAPIGSPRDARGPLDIDPLDDPLGRPPDPSFQHPIAHVATNLRGADPFDSEAARPARTLEPDDDLFRGIAPNRDWQGAPRSDHAPATSQAIPPPRVVSSIAHGEIDFDALIGDLQAPGMPSPPPPRAPPIARPGPAVSRQIAEPDPFAAPAHFAELEASHPAWPEAPSAAPQPAPVAPQPQTRIAPPPPAPPPPAPHAPDTAPPALRLSAQEPDARAALAAFLDGAGVTGHRIADGDPEAALRAAGKIFRAMTEGVREVLISRAAIKSEMRLEQTMIAAHGNNALKFSVTADDAVSALLTPGRPGYMDPLAATQEAFGDIKSHEIAVMAGVQTALLALLRRFDPDELEKRLTTSVLGSVLPSARKARYWDAFRQTHGDISREAEDDFQAVFGRSFAKAYSAQTRKD